MVDCGGGGGDEDDDDDEILDRNYNKKEGNILTHRGEDPSQNRQCLILELRALSFGKCTWSQKGFLKID